ncbi:MAG: hypothetical protein M3Q97_06065 [Bacteroidota bacterium]|nr:hypothetical protein [Bacteroidota bacterium]
MKIIIIFLFLLSAQLSQAQISSGFYIGSNVNSVTPGKKSDVVKPVRRWYYGFQGGVFSRCRLRKRFW